MKGQQVKHKMKKWVALAIASNTLMSLDVYADSIARGQRGPTDWQADIRMGVAEKENLAGVRTRSLVNNNVIKYWNGGARGVFGFVAVPYKLIDNGTVRNSGLGDITLGGSPRFAFTNSLGSFHFLPYTALTFPTGDANAKPTLGNDRYDLRLGTGFTYLTHDKKGEVGGALEYSHTSLGSKLMTSDELYGGVLVGGALGKHFRFLSGVTGIYKIGGKNDREYVVTERTAFRYTPKNSKRWHAEAWADFDFANKGMAKGKGLTLMIRINR